MTLDELLGALDDIGEETEQMNNQLLDLELEIEAAQRESRGVTYKRLLQHHDALTADARRLQFRLDHLNFLYTTKAAHEQTQAVQEIATYLKSSALGLALVAEYMERIHA